MARSYTRGQGFSEGDPIEDLAAVILAAAARLLADPTQVVESDTKGPFSVTYRDRFASWTTAELYVLNRYRKRAT